MSKEWVDNLKAKSDKELIEEINNFGGMDNMSFKDLVITEMLIRILKRKEKSDG